MHFLQPIWLAAMAGVVLPVIVHFWNDRRGKVLQVGSVALLEGASQRMSWSRRISQWWLLLVRCLLVMVLALLLAGPYWTSHAISVRGWVLADSGARAFYGKRIDSLVKEGWTRRELRGDDYWRAFVVEDRRAPGAAEFQVFSSGLINHFQGVRPSGSRSVHWEVYAPKDSVKEWIEKTWAVSADSARVMRGVARLTGSVFTYETVARDAGADTSTLEVNIRPDEHYLAAALKAVQEFTRRRIRVRMTGSSGAIGDSGWKDLVWSRKFPALVARRVLGEEGPGVHDLRLIDPEQAAPLKGKGEVKKAPAATVDLGPAAWLLLLLLFVTERWLSKRV
ncbi:MAG TPA: BatA domain-containing protein [Puia sp.]